MADKSLSWLRDIEIEDLLEKDAMGRLSSDLPNLFLTIPDFAKYYKTVWKSR